MSYTWEGRRDPYYLRLKRTLRRPSAAMSLTHDTTTVQSLIDIVQRGSEHSRPFYSPNSFERNFYVDCDEVYPNIFIGDGSTAKNKEVLQKIGVTHVLNTAEGKALSLVDTDKYFYEDVGIKYLGFQLLDHPTTNISLYFQQAADFIQNALSSGGKVYVHCLMGISRSSTCVIAYLMLKRGMSAAEAIRTIRQKRSIHPNLGFLQQLADLDNSLRRKGERQWGLLHHY